jgi:outer membrane biosynthesis protein TonB
MRGTTALGAAVSLLLGGALLTCYAKQLNVSQDLGIQQGPTVQTFSGKIVSQNGVRLVLRDDDNNVWYHLDDQQKASQLFGKDVLVTGTFDGLTGTIRVQSIVGGKPPEKPPANTEEKKQNGDPARGATPPPASAGTVAPSARQVSPAQEPTGNVSKPRLDPQVSSESEALHRSQGDVSTSPVRQATSTFFLTLPDEAVSASSSVAISSSRLIPTPPGFKPQGQNKNLLVGRLLRRVDPSYPLEAVQQRIEGTVRLHAVIGKDGKILALEPVSGPPLLVGSAEIAVREWRYGPTLLDGRAIQTQADIRLVFRLPS